MDRKAEKKNRAPRNRTINLDQGDILKFRQRLLTINRPVSVREIENKTIHQDTFEVLQHLPENFVDLVFADPPYNLQKNFNGITFKKLSLKQYEEWLDSWMSKLVRILKPEASVYICGDWRTSGAIFNIAKKYFQIQNRITFEREKGRGANNNWKNCSEDIWFCTRSNKYYFNVDEVKIKRKVLAPYKDNNGRAKDWQATLEGNYRTTFPSNIWTDITVPFWSMPENTDHPTQKSEKLVAKVILASSKSNDIIFDPFLGSGTTSVVARKLGRRFVGIEIDEKYCCLAEKRLDMAKDNKSIQGYEDNIFWERNTLNERLNYKKDKFNKAKGRLL